MSVAIVTVNWNRWKLTKRCVAAVRRIKPEGVHVYIVDTGSTDDSLANLRNMGPGVSVIEHARNSGRHGGSNVGIAQALADGHEFILLLQNNVFLMPEALFGLMRSHADVMASGSKLAPVLGCVHFRANGDTGFVRAITDPVTGIPDWTPGLDPTKEPTLIPTDYVDSAVLFAHSSVFRQVGKFDERFYLKFDDADWCFRAHRAGHPILTTRRAAIIHDSNGMLDRWESPRDLYFFVRNQLLFAEKHCTEDQRLAVARQQDAEENFFAQFDASLETAFRMGVEDYAARRFGGRPARLGKLAETNVASDQATSGGAQISAQNFPKSPLEQFVLNTAPGPFFEPDADASPIEATPPVRLIAYYLPQFHPIPQNDLWWGKGFTEWTNVTRAVPRFPGHYQPRLPGELGFYDLRLPDILKRQAELAKKYGIFGFCFHYYWFSGTRLLEMPLELLLNSPDIDMPFCINWANENWTRRWDGQDEDVLIAQQYSPEDDIAFCDALIPLVRDPRYITIDGRPLIMVYRPNLLPDAAATLKRWRTRMRAAGIKDPYLVMAQHSDDFDPRRYGFDAAAGFPPHRFGWGSRVHPPQQRASPDYRGIVHRYDEMVGRAVSSGIEEYTSFPGVTPDWDNEARKPDRGTSFIGSNPKKYGAWLGHACTRVLGTPKPDERIVFINAWNEWAEGAYLEPDRHFGYAYLAETARTLNRIASLDSGGSGRGK